VVLGLGEGTSHDSQTPWASEEKGLEAENGIEDVRHVSENGDDF
jgi:hypothetical protein